IVGGAISGYCAIGSVESAITPTSVMTMLMTPAKIGRSIKKCGKFTELQIADCGMRIQESPVARICLAPRAPTHDSLGHRPRFRIESSTSAEGAIQCIGTKWYRNESRFQR